MKDKNGKEIDSLVRNDLQASVNALRELAARDREDLPPPGDADLRRDRLKSLSTELGQLGLVAEIGPIVKAAELLSRLAASAPEGDRFPPGRPADLQKLADLIEDVFLKGNRPALDSLNSFLESLGRKIGAADPGPGAADTAGAAEEKVEVDKTPGLNLLEMFKDELRELIERLGTNILNLESAADQGAETAGILREVMRAAHSLKGSAKMVGVPEVGNIAHKIEDVMKNLEQAKLAPEADLTDSLLFAADVMRDSLEAAVTGRGPASGYEDLLLKLAGFLRPEGAGPEAGAAGSEEPGTAAPLAGTKPAEPGAPADLRSDTIRVNTAKLDYLLNLIGEILVLKISLERRLNDLERLTREAEALAADWIGLPAKAGQNIKAGIPGIGPDRLLPGRRRAENVRADLTSLFRIFSDNVARLDILTRDLRDRSLEMRMTPAAALLDEFRRTARGIARQLGKEVRVLVEGAGTEVDRRLLEEIRSPLIHLIRNSLDHGIETADVRRSRGKDQAGTIRLSLYRKGSDVVIEFEDDGAGIDPEKVRRKAVEKGVIDPDRAESMSDAEARYLIFQPGFSTSGTVTEVSGRGVGMDVVKGAVDKLRGQVLVQSEVGQYTRFIVTVPANLSTVPVLMVESAGQVYAVPLGYIQSTRQVETDKILREGSEEVIEVDEEIMPLYRLGALIGGGFSENGGRKRLPVVVLRFQEMAVGIAVDRFIRQQETIVKPLGTFLGNVRHMGGATILDNGDPALVLEIADIFDTIRTGALAPAGGPASSGVSG